MGADLKKVNKIFEELWKKLIIQLRNFDLGCGQINKLKGLFYLTFLNGWKEGSGMTQMIQ